MDTVPLVWSLPFNRQTTEELQLTTYRRVTRAGMHNRAGDNYIIAAPDRPPFARNVWQTGVRRWNDMFAWSFITPMLVFMPVLVWLIPQTQSTFMSIVNVIALFIMVWLLVKEFRIRFLQHRAVRNNDVAVVFVAETPAVESGHVQAAFQQLNPNSFRTRRVFLKDTETETNIATERERIFGRIAWTLRNPNDTRAIPPGIPTIEELNELTVYFDFKPDDWFAIAFALLLVRPDDVLAEHIATLPLNLFATTTDTWRYGYVLAHITNLDTLNRLSTHPTRAVRSGVAANPNTPDELRVMLALAGDTVFASDPRVQTLTPTTCRNCAIIDEARAKHIRAKHTSK